jgi:hypothetical protein
LPGLLNRKNGSGPKELKNRINKKPAVSDALYWGFLGEGKWFAGLRFYRDEF